MIAERIATATLYNSSSVCVTCKFQQHCNPGIAIRTTMENSLTVQYAALVHQLTSKAKSMVRDIEPMDDVTFIRIRTRRHELMIAPGFLMSYYMSYQELIKFFNKKNVSVC